jgi:hypothetical protein
MDVQTVGYPSPPRRLLMSKRILYVGTIVVAVSMALAGVMGAFGTPPPASAFSARVANPWFPLKPGTRYVYTGVKDGQPSRDVVTVTHRTQKIGGVAASSSRTGSTCVAVSRRLSVERVVDHGRAVGDGNAEREPTNRYRPGSSPFARASSGTLVR